MYISLAGFHTHLVDYITYTSRHLPITQAAHNFLLGQLADGDYSFLEIRDGNAIEFVKVMNICDRIVIERGAEKTHATAFRCGTGIAFGLTMQGVIDMVCQMEKCDD